MQYQIMSQTKPLATKVLRKLILLTTCPIIRHYLSLFSQNLSKLKPPMVREKEHCRLALEIEFAIFLLICGKF